MRQVATVWAKRDPALLNRVRRMRRSGQSLAQIAEVLDVSKSMAAKLAQEPHH